MKNNSILCFVGALMFSTTACVQKAYKKTIVISLTVKNKLEVKSVGIRGNNDPLSWKKDFAMQEVIKDSLYEARFQEETPYKFTEIKFAINGEVELKDKPNRKLLFSTKSDTTFYNAIYDSP